MNIQPLETSLEEKTTENQKIIMTKRVSEVSQISFNNHMFNNLSPLNPENEFQVANHYELSSQILLNSNVTQIMRARLKDWLIEQSSHQHCFRETYSLASYYLDLYFYKGFTVQISEFQILGLTCFFIAAKQIGPKPPKITYETFSKTELVNWQKRILESLDYYLNPSTYIAIANEILLIWDEFISNFNYFSTVYLSSKKQSYLISKGFFERLDCMSLVLKTNDYKLNQLVINAFFIENRINCEQIAPPNTQTDIFQKFYCVDKYFEIFKDFLKFANCKQGIQLKPEIGVYILLFHGLEIDKNFHSSKSCRTKIQYMNIQTHNKKSILLARSIIER